MNDLSVGALSGESEIEVLESREAGSEYRLADGTLLRIKPIVIAITRVEGAEATDGEPVYNMKSTLIADVRGVKAPPSFG